MNEEQLLRKKIIDTANRSFKQNIYTYTNFLSIDELSVYSSMSKELKFITHETYGGNPNAERQVIQFGSCDSLGYEGSYPINIIKIAPLIDKFAENLSHRDYLGALMNLGIKRELIGDIIIKDKNAYIYCIEHIAEYICENLRTIKHTHVNCSIENNTIEVSKPKLEEIEVLCASLRIDAAVSSLTKLSRNSALELFRTKKIYINGIITENNSYQLKPNDTLVIRGYGKFIYKEAGGETRKGRQYLKFEKYV